LIIVFYLLPIIWLLIIYFQHNLPGNIPFEWLFDSDALFLHAINKDIVSNHGRISDWYFPAAPRIFPSLFLIYLFRFIANDVFFVNIGIAIVQISIFCYFTYLLIKIFTNHDYATYFSLLLVSVVIFFFHIEPFVYYLRVDYHFGEFLCLLLSLVLTFYYLKNPTLSIGIGLFNLVIISTVSDPLLIAQYSIPIIFVLLLTISKKNKNHSGIIGLIVLASFLGYYLKQIYFVNSITNATITLYGIWNSLYHIKIFFIEHSSFLQNIFIAPVIISIIYSGIILFNFKSVTIKSKQLLILYYSFSFISTLFIFLLYPSNIQFRYLINIYILSIIIPVIFIFPKIEKTLKHNYFGKLILTCGLIGLYTFINTNLNNSFYSEYYPNNVRQFDIIANENNLKYGLADYWDASRIYMLTKSNIKGIVPAMIKGKKGIIRKYHTSKKWINTQFDFSYNIHPKIFGFKFYKTSIVNNDSIYLINKNVIH